MSITIKYYLLIEVKSCYVAQAGLKLTAILLPQPSNARITGMCHYAQFIVHCIFIKKTLVCMSVYIRVFFSQNFYTI